MDISASLEYASPMKIRGERECTECGTRWSYYVTGSVDCPGCGSLRSVGIDEWTEHTDHRVSFDLTPVRSEIDEISTSDLADRARERCREYVTRRGFVRGGDLRELDDTYLAATELAHVVDVISRSRRLDEREELYFLSLLRGADEGARPPVEEVPRSLRAARGIAYTESVDAYRRDLRTWMGRRELTALERSCFETLGDHVTRLRMLDGDVDPEVAERLVEATRDLADGLTGDEDALVRARERMDALG